MQGKVLIVDDEPDIRELLEITLGRMSLATESAADVRSAREKLESEHFDLCLTDMRLPDGDGLELVELIQQRYSNVIGSLILKSCDVNLSVSNGIKGSEQGPPRLDG